MDVEAAGWDAAERRITVYSKFSLHIIDEVSNLLLTTVFTYGNLVCSAGRNRFNRSINYL